MLTNQILPSTGWCSFLSDQLLKIQNKPLSIKVAVAVVGIFACCAIAYGCYIGLSALRNRISAQNTPNPASIDFTQNGKLVPLSRAQCQAAINIPNAAWVQVQCPYRTWDDVVNPQEHAGRLVLNVLPTLPYEITVDYQQVLDNGALIQVQAMSVADVQQEIARGEWVSVDQFARLTGVQR